MGKVNKGKSKKSSIVAHREDGGSGEEEKIPTKRSRGRPTKAHKEEETERMSEKDNNTKLEASLENINKKRKPSLSSTLENPAMVKDENDVGPITNDHELTKSVGFRHNGSRRKNKPRRAAEVGVSVCEVCSWLVLRS